MPGSTTTCIWECGKRMDSGVMRRKGAEKLEAVSSRLHEVTKVTEERGGCG